MSEVTITTETPPSVENQVTGTIVAGVVAVAEQQSALAIQQAAEVINDTKDDIAELHDEVENIEDRLTDQSGEQQWQNQEISRLQSQVENLSNQVKELADLISEVKKPELETPSETISTLIDTPELTNEIETEALVLSEEESQTPIPPLVEIPASRAKSFRLI